MAPGVQQLQSNIRTRLTLLRDQAKRQGHTVIQSNVASVSQDSKPTDYIVNVDEAALAKEIEDMEETLGVLDGQLSLKNATTLIEE